MAHALLNYDGVCRNIHGHSYQLFVTVKGKPLEEEGHPKDGMVMDFTNLDMAVQEIIDTYEHALVLNEKTSSDAVREIKTFADKVVLTPFQPTCENLLLSMVETIQQSLPDFVKLYSVRLYETVSSYAEWCAEE